MAPSEEEQRRLEEARRKAEEEEERRLEEEVERQTESLQKLRGKKKPHEEDPKKRKEEEQRKAEEERRKREEEERRAKAEEDRRRHEEEQRRRADEESRRQREEEERKRREEDRKKREEEERKRAEEDHRRRDEEERRRREEEETKRQQELERTRKEEDEQLVTDSALNNARTYFEQKDFDKALAELEKLLAVNPMHAEGLAFDEVIRKAKAVAETEQARAAEPAPVEAPKPEEPPAEEPKAAAEEQLPAPPTAPAPAPLPPPSPPAPKKPFPKGIVFGSVAVVLAVVVGIVVYNVTHKLLEGNRYIAVLPFSSQSNNDEERTVGSAIASDIGTALGYFPDARVMDPASAILLQRTSRDPRAEANRMSFAYTLTGSIALGESRVVLNLTIADSMGNSLWSGKIEKGRDNLAEIAGEAIRSAADALSLTIPETIETVTANKRTRSTAAYLAYLRGLELQQRNSPTASNNAVALFQQATAKDPGFADAYASTAYSLYHMYETGWSSDDGLLSQAQTLASKALDLNPSLARANTVVGGVAAQQNKYAESLSALGIAVTTMPSNIEAHRIAAVVYTIGGDEAKATEHITAAYELAPLNTDVLTTGGFVYQRFGKPKEAVAFFDQALPFLDDTLTYLAEKAGNTLVASYEYDRAIALFELRVAVNQRSFVDQYKLARTYQLSAKDPTIWSRAFEKTILLAQQEIQQSPQNALAHAYLGLAYSRFGRFPEGEASGKKAVQLARGNPVILYKLADIYSIQQKKDEAISALRDAIASRYVLQEIVDLDLFNIADEPEFSETITKELQ